MRKNARIIQISGLRGIVFIIFVGVCLTAGFIVFPGLVGMCLWNSILASNFGVPEINILQGVLLWGIVAFAIYLSGGGKSVVCMRKAAQLNDAEIHELMNKIRTQTHVNRINSMMMQAEELKRDEKNNTGNKEAEASPSENKKENL